MGVGLLVVRSEGMEEGGCGLALGLRWVSHASQHRNDTYELESIDL